VAGDPWWLWLPPLLLPAGMLLGVAGGRPPGGRSMWLDGGDIYNARDEGFWLTVFVFL